MKKAPKLFNAFITPWTFALTFALLSGTCMTALAQQPAAGPYIGVSLGATLPGPLKQTGDGLDEKTERDLGAAAIGSVGYAFPEHVRIEAEANWRRAEATSVNGALATGHVSAMEVLGNVLYDIPIDTSYTGYVGVGAGGARVDYTVSPFGQSAVDDNDVTFAYQGIAGIAYNLSSKLALTADYRYFRTTAATIRNDAGGRTSGEFDAHTMTVGLRYSFGKQPQEPAARKAAVDQFGEGPFAFNPSAEFQPAAAIAQSPEPQAATARKDTPRSYVVFFEFDKSSLTPGGRGVIEQAATSIRQSEATVIQVTGHADRVGTESYNFRLSLRRANVVKAELIRLGIPPDQMEVSGKGMTMPAVQTAPGVREQRNRRVEITF